jgi:flavorubredoxin
MRDINLYDQEYHRLILLNESGLIEEDGVRSDQYLVMHDGAGVLPDPGGYGVMPGMPAEMLRHLGPSSTPMLTHRTTEYLQQ